MARNNVDKEKRKRKTSKGDAVSDIAEVLLYIPEILVFPFKAIMWILRVIKRSIGSVFDSL
ncbi:hypothetical protein [Bacillus thermotolerans]|uniref:hypothetical protein n=1 Tax=Bacillus thermotolerans TaxID=1221996 RepID=UPI0005895DA0|nr:hypothetical protein [Bacillus thermotolerans]KKB39946.1 hypothetical protein QY96_02679 [Bacillus thermotolerans]